MKRSVSDGCNLLSTENNYLFPKKSASSNVVKKKTNREICVLVEFCETIMIMIIQIYFSHVIRPSLWTDRLVTIKGSKNGGSNLLKIGMVADTHQTSTLMGAR